MRREVPSSSRRKAKKAMHSRAWLNCVEVTDRCQFADDRAGRVLLLKHDEHGRPYVDPETRQVAREWRRGKVRIGRVE